MTERQSCYTVATALPDEIEQRIIQLAGDLSNWRGIAQVTAEALEQVQGKRSKMLVYQRVADLCGNAVSTVRNWSRYQRDFGDWLDEMPMQVSIEQIKLAIKQGKLQNKDALVVMQERANETDKFGGMLCPPRVWAAQLAEQADDDKPHPVLRALGSASQNMATAVKHSNGDPRYGDLAKEIDKLAMVVDAMLEKAEAVK